MVYDLYIQLCDKFTSKRLMPGSYFTNIPKRDQFGHLVSRQLYWFPSILHVPEFFLTRIDTYSRRKFFFPACLTSASTTIQGFTEWLVYRHEIPHNTAFNQQADFTAKWMPHCLEAGGLTWVPGCPTGGAAMAPTWDSALWGWDVLL